MKFSEEWKVRFFIIFLIFLFTVSGIGIVREIAFNTVDEYVEHTLVEPQDSPYSLEIADLSTVKVSVSDISWGSATYIGNYKFLTAAHVVETFVHKNQQAKLIYGKAETQAEILWYNKEYDLAILSIGTNEVKDKLTFTRNLIAQDYYCYRPRLGDKLELVGNPFFTDNVHSFGMVAKVEDSFYDKYKVWKDIMLVSTEIAGGMSGGGVYDYQGNLVGVNVGIITVPTPMFTIPAGWSVIVSTSTLCDMLP